MFIAKTSAMPCILLPAGSNPNNQPRPSAPVPERGRAFFVVCACLPPPSLVVRGYCGAPLAPLHLPLTPYSARLRRSRKLRSFQSNFARKPPRKSLRDCFGSPGSLRYNLTLTTHSATWGCAPRKQRCYVRYRCNFARSLLVHAERELRSPVN
jgi:hypothetical protein